MEPLDYALAYLRRGWVPIPLCWPDQDGRCACGGRHDDRSTGKAPLLGKSYQDVRPTEEDVRAWWTRWPQANVGILIEPSGLVLVDLDSDDAIAEVEGRLTPTAYVSTGKGLHVYYRATEGLPGRRVTKWGESKAIDLLGKGYVVAPPSRHATGRVYTWDDPGAELGEAPQWVVNALTPTAPPKPRRRLSFAPPELAEVRSALSALSPDCSREEWIKMGMAVHDATGGSGAGLDLWDAWSSGGSSYRRGEPARVWRGFEAGTVTQASLFRAARDAGWRPERPAQRPRKAQPTPPPHTDEDAPPDPTGPPHADGAEEGKGEGDMGGDLVDQEAGRIADEWPDSDRRMALRLIERHGDVIRFARGGGWYSYSGAQGVWLRDGSPVHYLAGESAKDYREEVANAWPEDFDGLDDATQKVWRARASWGRQCEQASRLGGVVRVTESHPDIRLSLDELDADPMTFNAPDCTLDLAAGKDRDHSASDLLSLQGGVPWYAFEDCPTWIQFLHDIMEGDAEMVSYLQRVLGYCLTGDTREQCFWLLYGDGSNGKGTLLNVLKQVMGSYFKTAQFETFLDVGSSAIRNDLADLHGARLVSAVEPDAGVQLAEGLIKQLTGGDPLKARHLYQDPFTYTPQFKIFLSVNNLPRIKGTDHGIWRRIRVVPFAVKYRTRPDDPEDWPEADRTLPGKLNRELPGVFRWCAEGTRLWLEHGLRPPTKVTDAAGAYRKSMDRVGRFLEDRCVVGPREFVGTTPLYRAFEEWSADEGMKAWTKANLIEALEKRGIYQRRKTCVRGVQGVRLA